MVSLPAGTVHRRMQRVKDYHFPGATVLIYLNISSNSRSSLSLFRLMQTEAAPNTRKESQNSPLRLTQVASITKNAVTQTVIKGIAFILLSITLLITNYEL
ncbi:hypothetical protein DWW69_02070 [Bacteroides sp. AF16-49]|jgi:hypothetical protein|nr:hypothetical protein DXB63_03220 [Bacteroides sp. OM05-12]RHR82188.1 hypothetical protein DWW69_02070 [Bacteroides sp. AF16-49]